MVLNIKSWNLLIYRTSVYRLCVCFRFTHSSVRLLLNLLFLHCAFSQSNSNFSCTENHSGHLGIHFILKINCSWLMRLVRYENDMEFGKLWLKSLVTVVTCEICFALRENGLSCYFVPLWVKWWWMSGISMCCSFNALQMFRVYLHNHPPTHTHARSKASTGLNHVVSDPSVIILSCAAKEW